MDTQKLNNKELKQVSDDKKFIRNLVIGMIIGFAIMLVVGILINNIALGIATGPALGIGIGFGIHGILNRNNEDSIDQSQLAGKKKLLFVLVMAGLIFFTIALVYMIK